MDIIEIKKRKARMEMKCLYILVLGLNLHSQLNPLQGGRGSKERVYGKLKGRKRVGWLKH